MMATTIPLSITKTNIKDNHLGTKSCNPKIIPPPRAVKRIKAYNIADIIEYILRNLFIFKILQN